MERRGSDKISGLHTGLIIGSFALLAFNIILSWLTSLLPVWYNVPDSARIEVSWMLYALVAGMLISANLYKVPSFLKWLDKR